MGVKGLTSFVKDVKRAVSEELTIPVDDGPSSSTTPDHGPLIIDGWAWIYQIYLNHFSDTVKGGNYIGYTLYIRQFVAALRSASLNPVFLFDGPYLPSKIPTVLSRQGDVANNNSIFMRSTSRNKHFFQSMMGIPPLLFDCTVEALRQIDAQVIFTESEADSAVAEKAEAMGGWAASVDSDYFILCSRGTKCRGYVPLDSLCFLVQPKTTTSEHVPEPPSQDDDGFSTVSKGKKSKTRKQTAAPETMVQETLMDFPPTPEEGKLLGVRFTSYSSLKIASVLGIPPSMLPLLAALVGNDYTAPVQKRLLNNALPTGPQRITTIARIIKEESTRMASPAAIGKSAAFRSGAATPSAARIGLGRSSSALNSGTARNGGSVATSATATPTGTALYPQLDEALAALAQNDPVRFMVQNVVERILATTEANSKDHYVTSGEKQDLVDAIIDSVFTYSLLTHSSAPHLTSPSASFFKTPSSNETLRQYQKAYNAGNLERHLIEILTQRLYLSRMAPEDPDQKSIQATHARDLRRWLYATVFSVWGMDWARETLEEPENEDPDFEQTEQHPGAIPILAGPGPNKVNWEQEGDPDELIPVQTPPSSFGSSMDVPDEEEDDDEDEDELEDLEDEEVRSRPGSAAHLFEGQEESDGVKHPPAVMEYARKGERFGSEICPILGFDTLVESYREELGIEPPKSLQSFLSASS